MFRTRIGDSGVVKSGHVDNVTGDKRHIVSRDAKRLPQKVGFLFPLNKTIPVAPRHHREGSKTILNVMNKAAGDHP